MGAHRRGEGEEGQGRLGRVKLRGHGEGHGGRGCKGEALPVLSVLVAVLYWLAVLREEERERKEERRRKERRKRKKEGKEKKRKNMKKFLNLKIFKKIKDNFWSWSKFILLQKNYMSNYK
jgi:hypothetical protein